MIMEVNDSSGLIIRENKRMRVLVRHCGDEEN